MQQPWTAEFTVDWPSSLDFYDLRVSLIRAALEIGTDAGWRYGTDDVGLLWKKDQLEAVLRPGGIRVTSASGDPKYLKALVELVAARIRPNGIRRVIGAFQFVMPLAWNYDEARRICTERLLGSWAQSLQEPDFAVLMDGKTPTHSIQFEMGVVSKTEIPDRIRRRIGRVRHSQRADTPEQLDPFKGRELPPVALFLDSVWRPHSHDVRSEPDLGKWLTRVWEEMQGESGRHAQGLLDLSLGGEET